MFNAISKLMDYAPSEGSRIPFRRTKSAKMRKIAIRSWNISRGLIKGHSERGKRIRIGIVANIASKIFQFVIGVISVAVVSGFLGKERYGCWMMAIGTLSWLSLSDFGISRSTATAVGLHLASGKRKEAAESLSSGFAASILGSIVLILISILVLAFSSSFDLIKTENKALSDELNQTIAVCGLFLAIRLPLSIPGTLLGTMERHIAAEVWASLGALASFLSVVVGLLMKLNLPALAAIFMGTGTLISIFQLLWMRSLPEVFPRVRLQFVKLGESLQLLRLGLAYFLMSVGWIINSQADIFVAGKMLGPDDASIYSVANRLFSYLAIGLGVLNTVMIPAYINAFGQRNYAWMISSLKKHVSINLLLLIPFSVLILFFGPQIIRIWAGSEFLISRPTLNIMLLLSVIYGMMYPFAALLNGLGKPTQMAISGLIVAGMNIFLSIRWAESMGIYGIVLASIASYCTFAVIPAILECIIRLRKLKAST